MKTTFACLLAALCIAVVAAQKYTSKYDNVDIDSILANNRVLNSYLKCLMDKGPCTPEGRELKRLLPDALQSDCSKCTPTQQKNSMKAIKYLRANRPGDFNLLLNIYDPNGFYRTKHGIVG